VNKHTILVVDDSEATRTYLARFLSSRGYAVECLDSGEHVIARISAGSSPSLVLLDLLMPATSGLDVLAQMRRLASAAPTIVLSGVGQISTVVKAMRLGAVDYLMKPFEDEELELAIQNVLPKQELEGTENRKANSRVQLPRESDIISANPRMQRIREIGLLVAETDVPILISGESGVGKEVVARFIHAHSTRRHQPFVKINCAALPDDLLESELFGHERGAFTGAVQSKPGKFEVAHTGSILLDEIGEMSPRLQAKLLHVLQDSEFTRLGGNAVMHVEVRVMAATNRHLETAVSKGEFREDLFFRLNVVRLEVPPLRQRREDIPLLCHHFLEKYRTKYSHETAQLPREIMEGFHGYSWPGNVRQLENLIRRFLVLRDPELVLLDLREPDAPADATSGRNLTMRELSTMAAEQTEKEMILRALEETQWNRKLAARKLNICYKSLLNKLHKWGIPGRSRSMAAANSSGTS
jgi:two-component system response regulator AtoC